MDKSPTYFLSKYSDNTLEISWDAILHNITYFKNKLKPTTKVMLMVKAAAYGHYNQIITKKITSLNLADMLGVATIAEGVELRKEGIELPIMVQNVSAQYWNILVEHCLEPVIHSFETLHSFTTYLKANSSFVDGEYPIHLKINTGMNRLGFDEIDLQKLIPLLKTEASISVSSIMSHLSSSGNFAAESFTLDQITHFKNACDFLKAELHISPLCHILNTDGLNNYVEYQMDMVRLGIGLYGASEACDLKQELKTAAKLTSKIIATRRVNKEEYISYNRSGNLKKDSNIAILALGYADGLPRKLGNGNWEVEINGKLYPTIGNICMDLCILNLGKDELEVGTPAIVFGGQKTLFDFAEAQETITYEALTNIGNRMKRRLV